MEKLINRSYKLMSTGGISTMKNRGLVHLACCGAKIPWTR